jgi:A/G-specific adenine glycosylase
MHLSPTLSKKILAWYDNSKRNLPWRVSKKSPKKLYYRLLSEFMLQQTQVKTVIPYFKRFTKKYGSLESLSKISENQILKLWEGLGYYRRARNLLASTKILVKNYNSKLPNTFIEIKKLPGVGDYTASALIGLIHNEPTLAIDGNVRRVFSRYLNKKESKINFEKLIFMNKKNLFITNRNSDLIEALMEFGALICKPKDPKCSQCCLNKSCRYLKSPNKIKNYKRKKIKVMNYNIFCYVNKRKQIALTKENKINFLKDFNLPLMKKMKSNYVNKNWKFLKRYKNSISNLSLNINLYYKFSNKIPKSYNWYFLNNNNKDLIPSFTKKIFNQVSTLFS